MLRIVLIALAVIVVGFVGYSYQVSQPVVDGRLGAFEPQIADPSDAWTFARSEEGLIWVTAHEGNAVRGVNLTEVFGAEATADLVAFVADLDASAIDGVDLVESSFPLESLLTPLDYPAPSVAAGTNFKEHAEEVYSEDPPFLFPKLTPAGPWNETVPFVSRLDYEAELCMFPLADIDSAETLPGFGLVLCNDFTDRLTLIREIDLGEPLGRTGFASGKGCERCLPTGYLVVIPRSADFYLGLDLSLYVNEELRQQFSMSDVILPIESIISEAFASASMDYQKGNETVPLLPTGNIPKKTLILTGTAAGVMFRPVNFWNQAFYLQPGDVVRTEATYLGHLENVVVAD